MEALLEVVTLTVSEPRHEDTAGSWRGGLPPGVDPSRTDYANFAAFREPNGDGWVLQERGRRHHGPTRWSSMSAPVLEGKSQ